MKLLNTKKKRVFDMNGVTVVVNGAVVGRLTKIEVTDPELAERIAEAEPVFSIGCGVKRLPCPYCFGCEECES